jgi:hypothetical protein
MSDDKNDTIPPELDQAFTALAYYMDAKGISLIVLEQDENGEVNYAVKYTATTGVTLQ